VLAVHDYPCNVRELRRAVHRVAALARGRQVDLGHSPPELVGDTRADTANGEAADAHRQPLGPVVWAFEHENLLRAHSFIDANGVEE